MRLYVVVFRKLFYASDDDTRTVFVTELQDAKLFSLRDYKEARDIAQRIGGTVEGVRVEFDRSLDVVWKKD